MGDYTSAYAMSLQSDIEGILEKANTQLKSYFTSICECFEESGATSDYDSNGVPSIMNIGNKPNETEI